MNGKTLEFLGLRIVGIATLGFGWFLSTSVCKAQEVNPDHFTATGVETFEGKLAVKEVKLPAKAVKSIATATNEKTNQLARRPYTIRRTSHHFRNVKSAANKK